MIIGLDAPKTHPRPKANSGEWREQGPAFILTSMHCLTVIKI